MIDLAYLKAKALSLTTRPGVYVMKNAKNAVIYVGKAKNLKNRVSSYFRNLASHSDKVSKMVSNVHDFDFIVTSSEFDALILECSLIKQHKPKYNVLLKDSKGFCFVKITYNSLFPQISVVKKKLDDGATYFGPYVQYSHLFPVKQAIKNVNEIFMLPDCKFNFNGKLKKRPCLNFYIKKCMGVCCGKVSVSDYSKILNEAVDFLKNGSKKSIKTMKKQMEEAADELNFELAIKLRDRIKTVEKINKKSNIYLTQSSSIEVISYAVSDGLVCFVVLKYSKGQVCGLQHFIFDSSSNLGEDFEEFFATFYYGKNLESYNVPELVIVDYENFAVDLFEKYLKNQFSVDVKIKLPSSGVKCRDLAEMAHSNAIEILTTHLKQGSGRFRVLSDLTKILNLKQTPTRIEAYDISNMKNSIIVGAMVVFQNGWPLNNSYRKFKMKTVFSQNDYAAMEEVIRRRILRFKKGDDASFSQKPQLILIDGGKNHVKVVKKILDCENFDVPCFGMVKDEGHKTRALTDGFCEINVALNTNLFYFISNVQEEVHRFAINYVRSSAQHENLSIELTKIKGIGKLKAIKLLNSFSSMDDLKNVSVDKIANILKISLDLATKVKNFIQNNL